MRVFLIVAFTVLMHATRTFSAAGEPGSAETSLALGYVLLTAYFAGQLFRQARLPRLTGYIVTGLLAGPAVSGLLSGPMVENLQLVNGMAIAMIALTAGTELDLQSIAPLMRAIRAITLVGVLGTVLLLTATVWCVRGQLPFMASMGAGEALTISLVLGTVMVAQSPAVVVALRDEMHADGPVSRTVLGVVVLADLVVILLFAVVSTAAKAIHGGPADTAQALSLLAWEIVGSLVAGLVIGLLLAAYLLWVEGGGELFLVAVTFIVAEVGQRMHLDPLLVSLAAGMLVRNGTGMADALQQRIQASALPVYVTFFAVAGATLRLDVLRSVGAVAGLFVVVRAVGLYGGARLGARLAGAPPEIQRYAGFGLLPQAGLALALALLFAKTFPGFGAEAGTLTLGVVALNELLAPALYRYSLARCGEAHALRLSEPRAGFAESLGVGLDPQPGAGEAVPGEARA